MPNLIFTALTVLKSDSQMPKKGDFPFQCHIYSPQKQLKDVSHQDFKRSSTLCMATSHSEREEKESLT